jgi:hypothetical protein
VSPKDRPAPLCPPGRRSEIMPKDRWLFLSRTQSFSRYEAPRAIITNYQPPTMFR